MWDNGELRLTHPRAPGTINQDFISQEIDNLGTPNDVMVDGFIKTQRFIEASNVDAGLEGPQMVGMSILLVLR